MLRGQADDGKSQRRAQPMHQCAQSQREHVKWSQGNGSDRSIYIREDSDSAHNNHGQYQLAEPLMPVRAGRKRAPENGAESRLLGISCIAGNPNIRQSPAARESRDRWCCRQ